MIKIKAPNLAIFYFSLLMMITSSCSLPKKEINHDVEVNRFPEQNLYPYTEFVLENGMKVLIIEDHSLPRMSLGLLVKSGSLYEPSDKIGLNYFMAQLLSQGTIKRSAIQQSSEFNQIASELQISPGADSTFISASSLTSDAKKLLELFSDAILNPKFSNQEIERVRSRILAAIVRQSDSPSSFADQLIDEVIFLNHPYANLSIGNEKSIHKIARSDLIKQYNNFFRPNNSILMISGSFDSDFIESVKKVFSNWNSKSVMYTIDSHRKSSHGEILENSRLNLYSKPELKQAQIRFAHKSIRRNNPDFLKLKLANLILGGDFVSRLNFKVRDALGLTYSINSSFQAMLDNGSFEISTFCRNEKIKDVINEVQNVLSKFTMEGVTQKELDAAKSLMIGQFPAAIETTDKLAINLLTLRFFGIPDSYLKEYNKNVQAISLNEVNDIIKKYFHPEELKIVIYADIDKVLSQLVEIEKQYGPITIHKLN